MKFSHYTLIFCVCCFVMYALSSCRYTPSPDITEQYLEIIKFNQPEFKDYIMVVSDGENCGNLWGVRRYDNIRSICPDSSLYGRSPYLELNDDWLLINWKWGGMYYYKKDALVKYKWCDTIYPIHASWQDSELYACRPISEVYFLPPSNVEVYNGDTTEHNFSEYARLYNQYDSTMEKHKLQLWAIAYVDSIYMDFAVTLNKMMSDGDLEKYGHYSF